MGFHLQYSTFCCPTNTAVYREYRHGVDPISPTAYPNFPIPLRSQKPSETVSEIGFFGRIACNFWHIHHMAFSSTDNAVVKIVAIVIVAVWACAGATRLLYPGVWKWISNKVSWFFFYLCRPCRNFYNLNKSPGPDTNGLRQHYLLPVSIADNETFAKSFSEKSKPRKSEGSLRNPRHKRALSNCSTGAVNARPQNTADGDAFLERNGGRRSGRRRGGGRGGRGRVRVPRGGSFTHDTNRERHSQFDMTNPLQNEGDSMQDDTPLDSELDLEVGNGISNDDVGSLIDMSSSRTSDNLIDS